MLVGMITLTTSCDNSNDDTEKEKEPEKGIEIEDLVNSTWRPSSTFRFPSMKKQDWVYDQERNSWSPGIDEPFDLLISTRDTICFGDFADSNSRTLVNNLLSFAGREVASSTLREGRTVPDFTFFYSDETTACQNSERAPEVNHLGICYLKIEFKPQITEYLNPSRTVTTSFWDFGGDIYFIDKNTFALTYWVWCGSNYEKQIQKGVYFHRIK